uniref:Microtubule-associated protein Jupiter n=1 Tax=Clastoptera arizonana TaxID=38151 RepID=A0A1B6DD71_9HEMI
MTSTSFNVGLNTETKNSSKVLKPPGGGSSDIFGATEPQETRKPRSQPQQSSLFMNHDEPTPVRSKTGNDDKSHQNEPDASRFDSAKKNKDKFKSNIILGGDDTPPGKILSQGERVHKDSKEVLAKPLPQNIVESQNGKLCEC